MASGSGQDLIIPLYDAPDKTIQDVSHTYTYNEKTVQVMQIDLARSAVKDMQRLEKAGKPVTLGFGKHLYLRYGTTNLPFRSRPSRFRQELYTMEEADDHTQHMSFLGFVSHALAAGDLSEEADTAPAVSDAALDRMRQQYAAIDQEKKAHQTEFLKNVVDPKMKKATVSTTSRSIPQRRPGPQQSAAVSTTPSAAPPQGTSAAVAEAQRFTLLHLLAMGPTSEGSIQARTGIPSDLLLPLLDKFGEKSASDKAAPWSLAIRRFKELDVWRFPYPSDQDRRSAVDNAVRALDKLRLNPSDKIWQLLLPKQDRNKGLSLSRASLWPTDHRKLLGNIEGGKTPQHSKSADASKPKDMSDSEAPAKQPARKVQKAPKSAVSAAVSKPKKDPKALSSERIDDSDEEFEQSVAANPHENDAPAPPRKQTPSSATPNVLMTSAAAPGNSESLAKDSSPRQDTAATSKKRKAMERSEDGTATKVPTTAKENVRPEKSDPSREAKRVKASTGAPRPVVRAAQPSTPIQRPAKVSSAAHASKPTGGSGSSDSSRISAKAVHPSGTGTPLLKARPTGENGRVRSSSVTNGTRNGVKEDHSASTPSPSMASRSTASSAELVGQYNKLIREYNSLPVGSARRKSLIVDIKAAKSRLRRKSDASAIVSAVGESSADEPLSRRQTLEAYRRYYKYFQSYCTWKVEQQASPSSDKRKKDHEQFSRLAELQKDVLTGFEGMLNAFRAKPTGKALLSEQREGTVLGEAEAEIQSWKARAKFLEWKGKYENMRNEKFGDVEPEAMVALWEELGGIKAMRDRVVKSVALGFGKRQEGRLDEIELEKVFG